MTFSAKYIHGKCIELRDHCNLLTGPFEHISSAFLLCFLVTAHLLPVFCLYSCEVKFYFGMGHHPGQRQPHASGTVTHINNKDYHKLITTKLALTRPDIDAQIKVTCHFIGYFKFGGLYPEPFFIFFKFLARFLDRF